MKMLKFNDIRHFHCKVEKKFSLVCFKVQVKVINYQLQDVLYNILSFDASPYDKVLALVCKLCPAVLCQL